MTSCALLVALVPKARTGCSPLSVLGPVAALMLVIRLSG